jgi:transcriptional regulator with XRE-family HTH domain
MARTGRPQGTFKNRQWLDDPNYVPHQLLNRLKQQLGFKRDKQLAYVLGLQPNALSHIRRKRSPLSAALIIGIMDLSGLGLDEVRTLIGIPKPERIKLEKSKE